jgi:hypothetical protein
MSESVKVVPCRPQLLNVHAEQLMRERDWSWPEARTQREEEDVAAIARLWSVDDPETVEWFRRNTGARTRWLIEDLLIPDLVAMLPAELQRLVGRCIVVKAAWTARPQGVARHHRDEGVAVFVNGGLPLLVFDILGHALALIRSEEAGAGKTRIFIPEPPSSDRIRSVAALLVAFRDARAELDFNHLPQPEGVGFGGRSALVNLVQSAERFVIAHELGHALAMLQLIPEARGLRDLLAPIPLEPPNSEGWIEELSADAWALELLFRNAESEQPAAAPVAAVGCLLALEWSHVLDWVFTIPSQVPFPPEPKHPDYRQVFSPPADLRLHVATQIVESWSPEVLRLAEPYRVAMHMLLDGLHEKSGGGCIAPADRDNLSLCAEARGPHGWLCPRHAVIGR